MEKNQRLAKTREKKKRSPNLRLINHHKTHTYTLYIYLKHHGHHVREIVPAPLFKEGNAHFDGASRKRSGFSVVCFAVSFFLFRFFSPARIRSLFRFCGRKSSEREERFLNRDDFYARVVFLLNVPRLDAKRARGRMRRVYMRAIWTHRSIELILAGKTWNQPRISSVRFQSACSTEASLFRLKILVHFYERRFRLSSAALTLISLFLLYTRNTHTGWSRCRR